jgi:hypothetical protein
MYRKETNLKIISICKDKIDTVKAIPVESKTGELYFCLTHGEDGRGRWQLRFPIPTRIVKPQGKNSRLEVLDCKLVPLNKKDARGNDQYLIVPELWVLYTDDDRSGKLFGDQTKDNEYLVFWNLSPGYRGGASSIVSGLAEVIGRGEEAQGGAGRMGGSTCPVVRVTGPCVLTWIRTGRLYGSPEKFTAVFDGVNWTVNSADQCALEEAALNW